MRAKSFLQSEDEYLDNCPHEYLHITPNDFDFFFFSSNTEQIVAIVKFIKTLLSSLLATVSLVYCIQLLHVSQVVKSGLVFCVLSLVRSDRLYFSSLHFSSLSLRVVSHQQCSFSLGPVQCYTQVLTIKANFHPQARQSPLASVLLFPPFLAPFRFFFSLSSLSWKAKGTPGSSCHGGSNQRGKAQGSCLILSDGLEN